MLEARLVTVTGDVAPVNVAGEVVGDGLTINDVGDPPVVDAVNATDALPLSYARPDPLFVATIDVGGVGGAAIGNQPFNE